MSSASTHPLNLDSDFDVSEEENCQPLTPRSMSMFDLDLDSGGGSRSACAEAMNASGWDSNSTGNVSSPSQHTFFDWLRERRISDESDWQPDLADLLTTLAGEDFRIFALEDKTSSLCRTESSKSSSPTRAGSSGAISEMSNRYCPCFYLLRIFDLSNQFVCTQQPVVENMDSRQSIEFFSW